MLLELHAHAMLSNVLLTILSALTPTTTILVSTTTLVMIFVKSICTEFDLIFLVHEKRR